MQKIFLFFFVTLAFSSCSQQPQYGKNALQLDQFNFNLDVASFFKDERIFRGKSDFSVSATEIGYEYKDRNVPFIQYATRSMSQDRTLARYDGMNFESLGMITDSADVKVLLVSAGTDYATGAGVQALLKKLQQTYGQATLGTTSSVHLEQVRIRFQAEGKVVKLALEDVGMQIIDEEEHDPDPLPFNAKYQARVTEALQKKKGNIKVMLFIVTPMFDEVLENARSFTGDLTRY